MKKALITILILGFVAASGSFAQASLTKPSYCKVAISGKDPLILKLDQYPVKELASFRVKEFSFRSLIISEIVFKQNPALIKVN